MSSGEGQRRKRTAVRWLPDVTHCPGTSGAALQGVGHCKKYEEAMVAALKKRKLWPL